MSANVPALSVGYLNVPLTTAPYQTVQVALGGQPCTIRVYTKSTNVPIQPPGSIATDPPTYENINPIFVDLEVNGVLVIGGVIGQNKNLIVRSAYLRQQAGWGPNADLVFYDLTPPAGTDGDDPTGVPARLPPPDLRNFWQRNLPVFLGGKYAPGAVAGSIPGLGTRFILTWWPSV